LENFEALLKLLHPFMPFVSEEAWHQLRERGQGNDLMMATWPAMDKADPGLIQKGEQYKMLITSIRKIRKENGLKPKELISLMVRAKDTSGYDAFKDLIQKLGFVESLEYVDGKVDGARSFLIGTDECFVPVSINVEDEISRIKKELDYNRGFLKAVDKKLSNERFVNNAPEAVVLNERQKKEDAEAKIRILEESLLKLN